MGIMGRWRAPGCRWVYFAERDGLIKIGYSANVDQRMRQLGARLLALMPGGNGMERRMHRLFAEYRSHDEWFHPGLSLVGFITALHGDDPYFRLGLPEAYSRAEASRLVAEQRAETERAAQERQAENERQDRLFAERLASGWRPPLTPGDREAADLIGELLRLPDGVLAA